MNNNNHTAHTVHIPGIEKKQLNMQNYASI